MRERRQERERQRQGQEAAARAKRQREEEEARRSSAPRLARAGFRSLGRGHAWHPRRLHRDQEAEAQRLGLPVAIEHVVSGMALVLIPGGDFMMGAGPGDDEAYGAEKPLHLVRLRPCYTGVAPLLQEQWRRMMGSNPSLFRGVWRPVEQIYWEDCQEFCRTAGGGLRLPTEAEWERMARGGTETRYWWGNGWDPNRPSRRDRGPGGTWEVGRYGPNPYGVLDAIGNVWEWCEDEWHDNYVGAPTDGSAWLRGDGHRVMRGGSWDTLPMYQRVSYRGREDGSDRNVFIGARLVRDAMFH